MSASTLKLLSRLMLCDYADQSHKAIEQIVGAGPVEIDVYVAAPEIEVRSPSVSISPQIKVNAPELSRDIQFVMPPPAERQIVVQHSDGTESVVTVGKVAPSKIG